MARLANEGSDNFVIRTLAAQLCQDLQQKDFAGEARACLAFVRDKIRYIRDPVNAETLHTAGRILEQGYGDCDDKCILLAAMLLSIGFDCRFIAVAMQPDDFSHVWLQAKVYDRWLDLEPTEPVPLGDRIPDKGIVETIYQGI